MMSQVISVCLALFLSACAALSTSPGIKATVTGISTGRASAPTERSYVLRTAAGRVFMVSQVLDKPPNIGDVVIVEPVNKGEMRIVGPAK